MNLICLLQTYLAVCKDVIMVGLGDPQFQIQLLQRSLGIMQSGTASSILEGLFMATQLVPTRPSYALWARILAFSG